jgi:ribosomal protein S18 acetylase RimI-like enzyme
MERSSNYILRSQDFTESEILGMADIHLSEIQDGFLTTLGRKPMRLLYEFASSDEICILVAAFEKDNPRPLGLIWGTLNCASLYWKFVRRCGLRAVAVFLPRMISFERMRKAIETFIYPARKENAALPKAEILNFAVRPDYRGTGLAEGLFRQLMDQFKARGVPNVKIVTGEGQERAHKFYEKMGATKAL